MKKYFFMLGFILLLNNIKGQLQNIEYNGVNRSYLVYVPKTYDGTKPFSLIFAIHGMGNTAENFSKSGLNERADIFNFIVVYPNGINNSWDINATNPLDVGFFSLLTDTLKAMYNIDPDRIYATGHSLGGFMSYILAVKLPDKIKAVAPVEGLLLRDMVPTISTALPVLHIHALDDPTIPYLGDGYNPGADSITKIWRQINNCRNDTDTIYNNAGVIGFKWKDEKSGNDVELFRYTKGGHSWLSEPLNCNDLIIDFFYTHPKREIEFSLTSPIKHLFDIGSDIQINTSINPIDSVNKIELYANSNKIATLTNKPFNYLWTNVQMGDYIISAKAYCKNGAVVLSSFPKQIHVVSSSISIKKPCITSSTESSMYPGSSAFDNDFSTRWSSSFSDPQWICVNLGNYYKIYDATLFWEAAYGTDYKILASKDFVNWKNIYTTGNADGGTDYIPLDSSEAKFVWLYGTERSTPYGYSLYEYRINGDSADKYTESTEEITITGKINMVNNPSGNKIKFFSTVSSIHDNSTNYVITKNGFWVPGGFTVNNTIVNQGDSVTLTGLKREKADSSGNKITEIEPTSVTILRHVPVQTLNSDNLNLKQNSPNPCNDFTKIEYTIPKKQWVNISIYNLQGKLIGVETEKIHEAGSYNLILDCRNLPEGIYNYCLTTSDASISRKFIILR